MSGTYEISVNSARDLLRLRFRGFFCPEDLAGYVAAKGAALANLSCGPNEHIKLCDFSECIPQSQRVLDLFKRTLDDPAVRSRRLAVIVSGALGQFQALRIVTRPDAACFKTVGEAERRLFDETGELEPSIAGAVPPMSSLPAAPRRGRSQAS